LFYTLITHYLATFGGNLDCGQLADSYKGFIKQFETISTKEWEGIEKAFMGGGTDRNKRNDGNCVDIASLSLPIPEEFAGE